MSTKTPLICVGPGQSGDLGPIDVRHATSFGAAVLALRSRLGRSQSRVAVAARIAAGYYSDIENNRRPAPPRSTALRLAAALDLAPDEVECLAALADAERTAVRTDAHLPPDARALLRAIRLAAPRLTPAAISLIRRTVEECCE